MNAYEMHMNIRINIVKIDKMVYNIYRGDIMQIIDQMIAEIVNLFIDFLSRYWLLGGGIILGFFFRCDLYKTKIGNSGITKKKSADNYCLCNGVNYNVEFIIFESTR